jgi:phosphatidylserine/phosphatidylglycerophosphate/cardiolipin synthase-like enzyme
MPLRQTPRLHIPYFLLAYGSDGAERTDDPDGINHVLSARILEETSERLPSDVFIQCHGWLDNIPGAIVRYDEWIDSMADLSADISAMGSGFSPLWIGLHWPSLPWGQEEIPTPSALMSFTTDHSRQSQLLESYLERLGLRNSLDAREALGTIFRANRTSPVRPYLAPDVERAYRTLLDLMKFESDGMGSAPDTDMAAFDPNLALRAMQVDASPLSFSIGGSLLSPLRVLSFWNMKRRARTVGENGMHDLLKAIQSISQRIRVHITGHSFGCIVGTSIIAGPGGQQLPARSVDSLALLQGAVSLWSFADRIPATNGVGYYNAMLRGRAVAGPIITTQSKYDRATGVWYPAAVGLVLADPSFAAAGATMSNSLARWGAVGTWGVQGVRANDLSMAAANHEYGFEQGSVYNLQSDAFIRSGGGFEGAHRDIHRPEVSHAVWQAALRPAPRTFALEASGRHLSRKASAPRLLAMTEDRMPIPFGVQAETGRYLPSIQREDLSHIDPFTNAARTRGDERLANNLSTMVEVDPNDLKTAGWAAIFPAGMDSSKKAGIQSALKPLLDLRSSQAGDLFRLFEGSAGYQADQTAESWLEGRGSGFFPVNPAQGVPYYLLLVGSPDEIPFTFQYDLDMYFAVGRIFFETPQEYSQYAKNIESFEKGGMLQPRNIAIFNPRNEGDAATGLLHDQVAWPLVIGGDSLPPIGKAQGFNVTNRLAGKATKQSLLDLLGGKAAEGLPTVLFTGSHGVAFSLNDPGQQRKQGAILTQDWGGPGTEVSPDTYLIGDEILGSTNLLGMIHFFFACYSGGCPQFDTYCYGPNEKPVKIAQQTFLARLPQRLLLLGTQAVIGHIDRSWVYSFQTQAQQPMMQVFRDPLVRLLQQNRVGHALDVFDQRWTVLSTQLLSTMQLRKSALGRVSDASLANRWVARDDARNYVVIGDPATRLRLAPAAPATPQPMFAPRSLTDFASAVQLEREAPVESLDSFPVHAGARPKLTFREFTGTIRLTAAVSPDCSYQLVAAAIAEAGRASHLDAYIYAISAPYLIDLLNQAQQRGTKVRVMYDPDQMKAPDAKKLKDLGFDVKVAPSHDPRRVFTVCHEKFFVIDRRVVVLGSANWGTTSIPERRANESRKIGNREWLARVDDEAIASWYQDLFNADWNIPDQHAALEVAVLEPLPTLTFRAPRLNPPHDFPVTAFGSQQMTVTPLTSPDNYFGQTLQLIQGAKLRVWLQQQYIEEAGGPAVPQLLDAIAKRQRDGGVDVRIVISSRFPKNWEASKATLQDAGLFDHMRAINLENFVHCHNKGVIVDGAAVVSSTNWSENSIRSAREAGLLIHSPAVSDFYASVFDDDWKTGWSVDFADNKRRSFAVEGIESPGEGVEIEACDQV